MLQKILNKLLGREKPTIYTTNRNYLMINADIRHGTVIVSYKGKIAHGKFEDNTLRQLMKGEHYTKHANEFFTAVGRILKKIIKEK